MSLQLTNEDDDDIVIDALQGTLAIEGENVAQAALDFAAGTGSRARHRARGNGAHTGMDAMLRAVAAAMRRGATIVAPGARPTLRYSIEAARRSRAAIGCRFRAQAKSARVR